MFCASAIQVQYDVLHPLLSRLKTKSNIVHVSGVVLKSQMQIGKKRGLKYIKVRLTV